MAKSRVRRGIMLGVLLAAAGGGVYYWWTREEEKRTDALVLYGNVEVREVALAFQDSERIESLLVQEGDRVRKGQELATLQTARLDQAVARDAARVESQRAVVAALEAGSRPQEIQRLQGEYDAALADERNAAVNYERFRVLVEQKSAPAKERDDAKAALDIAQGRLKAAKEALDLAIAGPRVEDIQAAKATLKEYEAALALSKRQQVDAHLLAPAGGIVRTRILEPGDMASPQTPVFTLALDDPVWVRAYVGETDLGKIAPGMKAHVMTDSFPDKRYEGWIGYISPTAEFTPRSVETPELRTKLVYQVRVYVRNPRHELRLGMPATVVVPLDQQVPPPPADGPKPPTKHADETTEKSPDDKSHHTAE